MSLLLRHTHVTSVTVDSAAEGIWRPSCWAAALATGRVNHRGRHRAWSTHQCVSDVSEKTRKPGVDGCYELKLNTALFGSCRASTGSLGRGHWARYGQSKLANVLFAQEKCKLAETCVLSKFSIGATVLLGVGDVSGRLQPPHLDLGLQDSSPKANITRIPQSTRSSLRQRWVAAC